MTDLFSQESIEFEHNHTTIVAVKEGRPSFDNPMLFHLLHFGVEFGFIKVLVITSKPYLKVDGVVIDPLYKSLVDDLVVNVREAFEHTGEYKTLDGKWKSYGNLFELVQMNKSVQ